VGKHRAEGKTAGSEQQVDSNIGKEAEVDGNSKIQITTNKTITMTEIVRSSLGLPTLRAGPQFRNSNAVWVIGSWILGYGFQNV